MTKRQYQLFAILLFIGAPLLVSMLSNWALGINRLASGQTPAQAEPAPPPEIVEAPAPEQPHQQPPSAPMENGLMSAAPTLDPSGIAVESSDPSALAAGSSPARAPQQAVMSDDSETQALARDDH